MSYRHLTLSERETIANLLFAGHGPTVISRALGRSPSTISREIGRNSVNGRYRPSVAHQRCLSRRSGRPLQRKISHPPLRSEVQRLLSCCWSPDQVSGRLKRVHPEDRRMHVSHQTIYRWLWSNSAIAEEFAQDLRHGRYRRRKKSTRTLIQNRVSVRQSSKHVIVWATGKVIRSWGVLTVDTWPHSWIAAVAIWWPPGCVTSDRSA